MIFVGVLLRNQELRCADKVVKNVLLFVEHACAVPILAELGASAKVCDGKNAAMLQPQIAITHKTRSQADVKTAIAGQECRICSVEFQALLVKDEHRHASAILGVKPELLDFILVGIHPSGFYFAPQGGAPIGKANLIDRIRDGERVKCKERFFAVPLAAKAVHAPDCGQTNIAK